MLKTQNNITKAEQSYLEIVNNLQEMSSIIDAVLNQAATNKI